MSEAQGSCLCGDVQFFVQWPSKWVVHCHCSLCRRAHGAAFVTWLGMSETQCQVDDPASRLRWYVSTPGAERGFCNHCGSTLFFRSARWPGELHIALANLVGDADRLPSEHVHWDAHVTWAKIDPEDGIDRKTEIESK